MTPKELAAAITAGIAPAVLDVRSPEEYASGHVPGAINLPFTHVGRRAAELAGLRHHPLVIYCGHGPRAWIAGASLRRRQFTRIGYLTGHMRAWRRAGLPEERGTPPPF